MTVGVENYVKTVRPADPVRHSEGGQTRVVGSRNFDTLAVGAPLPGHHSALSRGDLVNYAGGAGDANPIHWDENIAKLAGLPDVIAHGMLTLGLGAGYAASWCEDPGAIARYAVRLSAPAIVPSDGRGEIEFGGRIKSLDPDTRSGVVIITAKSVGKKIFGMATMGMRFA